MSGYWTVGGQLSNRRNQVKILLTKENNCQGYFLLNIPDFSLIIQPKQFSFTERVRCNKIKVLYVSGCLELISVSVIEECTQMQISFPDLIFDGTASLFSPSLSLANKLINDEDHQTVVSCVSKGDTKSANTNLVKLVVVGNVQITTSPPLVFSSLLQQNE